MSTGLNLKNEKKERQRRLTKTLNRPSVFFDEEGKI